MRAHLVLAIGVLLASPAAWAVTKIECVQASDRGQDLRDQGKLLAARDRFLTCGAETCPAVVRAQCHAWLAELERQMPTVLLRVRDAAGLDVVDVKVSIDGVPSARGPDGRSVAMDPGVHVFRFEAKGLEASELRPVIRESEKDRLLDVTLRPASPAQPMAEEVATPPTPSLAASAPVSTAHASVVMPVVTASLGAVAVAGGVLFAYFANDGKTRVDHLRATCAPDCPKSDVEAVAHQVEIANTALVIGAVAAAGAVGLLLWRPLWHDQVPSVGAGPTQGGAMAWVGGRF
jgi:hypothetical protein